MTAINLLDFDRRDLTQWLVQRSEKPFRAQQIFQWLHQHRVPSIEHMATLSQSLRNLLLENTEIRVPTLKTETISQDGTIKWLLNLVDDSAIETVYIPEDRRATLCVSSQAGCILDCQFCLTGKQGFHRNLTTAEIIGQLYWANRRIQEHHGSHRAITNVVMMGMGEPLLNVDNVVRALRIMHDDFAYGLSRRRITVSSVGVVPGMVQLAAGCPVSLAISLHAPNNTLRSELMAINKKYPLEVLIPACQEYLKYAPRPFLTFEYVLLHDINDQVQHAMELMEIARHISCKINIIPWNPFPGVSYCPSRRVKMFSGMLRANGIVATIRKKRGDDIFAACGQLSGSIKDRTKRSVWWLKNQGEKNA